MFIYGHFQIQTSVFCQVTMCVAVLGAENCTDFVNSTKIAGDTHLLRQLWTLRKESLPSKIIYFENASTRLRSSTLELWSVNLDKSLCLKIAAEDIAYARL